MLRKDSAYKKGISSRLIEMYLKAVEGERHRRIKDLEHLHDVCFSMHHIIDADTKWGVPACELNPANLDCLNCKGFKHSGICAHVLAINHILKKVNLRRQVLAMAKNSRKKNKQGGISGNQQHPLPALRKEVMELDSSDEEEERLLLLGDRGM